MYGLIIKHSTLPRALLASWAARLVVYFMYSTFSNSLTNTYNIVVIISWHGILAFHEGVGNAKHRNAICFKVLMLMLVKVYQ